jgi:hypothetical protein
MHLETAASAATNDSSKGEDVLSGVVAKFDELKAAVKNYHEYLESIEV